MENKELSIIIPTYNRKDILIKTLGAINEQNYDMEKVEVLVIDDFSQKNPQDEIVRFGKKIKLRYKLKFLRLKENIGQGKVRNKGIELANGGYILFIGDDTIPDKNLIKEHMKSHKESKGIAVLGKVSWADEVRNDFMDYIEKIQFHYYTIKDKENVKLHFYTSNISLEKKWLDNEKYSPEFKNYGLEDLELGYRLEKKGLRVVYNSDAVVYHFHSYNFLQFCRRMKNVGKSAAIFARLHPELKRRYIPYFINVFKIVSFFLSRRKILNEKLYWYSNFIYFYIKGIEEQITEDQKNVEKSKSFGCIFKL